MVTFLHGTQIWATRYDLSKLNLFWITRRKILSQYKSGWLIVRPRPREFRLVLIKWVISLLSGIRDRLIKVWVDLVLVITLENFKSVWI